MANLINESEIRDTWSPIIESATGINDSEKLAWMSQYCHNHKLNEDAGIVSLNPSMTLTGIGPATVGTSTAGNALGSATSIGSGDKAPSLLPLAMQVAAQTIGLDLVPVVPMAGPMGLLSYLDFNYEGGTLGASGYKEGIAYNYTGIADGDTPPTFIKADATEAGAADVNWTAGSSSVTAPQTAAGYEFMGASRIDGKSIFRLHKSGHANGGTNGIVGATVVADLILAIGGSPAKDAAGLKVELVSALEDHLEAASGNQVDMGATASPYTRELGESTFDRTMGLALHSKTVAAETFQIAAAVTREQVQDLKQFGVDAVAQVESVLTNELSQAINSLILGRIDSLGTTNVTNALGAGGLNITLQKSANMLGGQTISGEHRKIMTGILAAANLIANRGRRGAGNFAVVGAQVATVLQSVSGYVPAPMANTVNQSAGSIYPVGSIAGVNIYTDPRKAWTDFNISVGRKGDGNGAGLVFMPYLMAESVQTIAEGTMAPKVAVKSRFALVEAGHHPETQYAKFAVTISNSGTVLTSLS